MSVNKVILVGHVGKDPEIKYFEPDVAVARFTLATTDRAFKTRDGKEIPERTEWHNIVAWRGLAKIAENYIKKGSQIFVEGQLRTRSYDDQNGIKRYTTEIFADVIQLLGKKQDNAPQENASVAHTVNNKTAATGETEQQQSVGVMQTAQNEDDYVPGVNDVEDDLPF